MTVYDFFFKCLSQRFDVEIELVTKPILSIRSTSLLESIGVLWNVLVCTCVLSLPVIKEKKKSHCDILYNTALFPIVSWLVVVNMSRLPYSYRTIRFLSYKYTKRLNCTPKEIFGIVLNVSDYKKFIPYIKDSNHHLDYLSTENTPIEDSAAQAKAVENSTPVDEAIKDTRAVTTKDYKVRGVRGIKGIRNQIGTANGTTKGHASSTGSANAIAVVQGAHGTGHGDFTTHWSLYKEKLECTLDFKVNEYVISSCKNDLFKYLYCQWSFHPVKNLITKQDQCDVEISLNYEFNNFLYNNLSSLFSKQISQIMVKAFETRLAQLRATKM